MNYLYHRVPHNMSGTILYPLNTLKEIKPEVYRDEVEKYAGRGHLLKTKVPILNCLWNDVVFLTAVTPNELMQNLREGGFEEEIISCFKIPVEAVLGASCVAFIYQRNKGVISDDVDYEAFDSARMQTYREVPSETISHYKERHAEGNRPLFFHYVPHILYKGSIDTSRIEIITV